MDELDIRDDGTVRFKQFDLVVRPLPYAPKRMLYRQGCGLACINFPVRSRIAVLWNWTFHKLQSIPFELRLLAFYLGIAKCEHGGIPRFKPRNVVK
jgi:hypothetical protein